MSTNAETCAGLIWDICDVALGAGRIEQALGDFARLGGAERAALISIAPNGAKAIAAASDFDASAIDSYNREFHRLDAIVPAEGSGPSCSSPARRRERRSVRDTSAAISTTPGRVRTTPTRSPS